MAVAVFVPIPIMPAWPIVVAIGIAVIVLGAVQGVEQVPDAAVVAGAFVVIVPRVARRRRRLCVMIVSGPAPVWIFGRMLAMLSVAGVWIVSAALGRRRWRRRRRGGMG